MGEVGMEANNGQEAEAGARTIGNKQEPDVGDGMGGREGKAKGDGAKREC